MSYRCSTLAEVERLMEQYVASVLCGLYLSGYMEFFSGSCRTKMAASISIVFLIDHPTMYSLDTISNEVSNVDLFWNPLLSVGLRVIECAGNITSLEKYCMLYEACYLYLPEVTAK